MNDAKMIALLTAMAIEGCVQAIADTTDGWYFFPYIPAEPQFAVPFVELRNLGNGNFSVVSSTLSNSDNGPVTRLVVAPVPTGTYANRPFYSMNNPAGAWVVKDGTLQLDTTQSLNRPVNAIFSEAVQVINDLSAGTGKGIDVEIASQTQLDELGFYGAIIVDCTVIVKGEWGDLGGNSEPSSLEMLLTAFDANDLQVVNTNTAAIIGTVTIRNAFTYVVNKKWITDKGSYLTGMRLNGTIKNNGTTEFIDKSVELIVYTTVTRVSPR